MYAWRDLYLIERKTELPGETPRQAARKLVSDTRGENWQLYEDRTLGEFKEWFFNRFGKYILTKAHPATPERQAEIKLSFA